MDLKVGDVVKKPNGLFIVTDTTSNGKLEFENFKDFINKNYAIEFEGDHHTLHEINQMLSQRYFKESNKTIIEMEDL